MWAITHIPTGGLLLGSRNRGFYSEKDAVKYLLRLTRDCKHLMNVVYSPAADLPIIRSNRKLYHLSEPHYLVKIKSYTYRLFTFYMRMRKESLYSVRIDNLLDLWDTYWPYMSNFGQLYELFVYSKCEFVVHRIG